MGTQYKSGYIIKETRDHHLTKFARFHLGIIGDEFKQC